MPNWMNLCLGEPIGLLHAYEQRYYQNKTMLHFNFGSVYIRKWVLPFVLGKRCLVGTIDSDGVRCSTTVLPAKSDSDVIFVFKVISDL